MSENQVYLLSIRQNQQNVPTEPQVSIATGFPRLNFHSRERRVGRIIVALRRGRPTWLNHFLDYWGLRPLGELKAFGITEPGEIFKPTNSGPGIFKKGLGGPGNLVPAENLGPVTNSIPGVFIGQRAKALFFPLELFWNRGFKLLHTKGNWIFPGLGFGPQIRGGPLTAFI